MALWLCMVVGMRSGLWVVAGHCYCALEAAASCASGTKADLVQEQAVVCHQASIHSHLTHQASLIGWSPRYFVSDLI